jgi:chemotaxis methyl-accepting protein methylase
MTTERVAELLAREVGLRSDGSTRGRLQQCVADVAQAAGVSTADLVERLPVDAAAMQALLDAVTVQETSFFRDQAQLQALAEIVPSLPDPLVVWSAGCSNGQEPYSIAMVLAESGRPDWRVIATDVSQRALERARAGVYHDAELRGLSNARRRAFGRPTDTGLEISDALRRRIEFKHHNLARHPPPPLARAAAVVFCRNVLIYFRHDVAVGLLARLARSLRPGTWLFTGYAESLDGLTDAFTVQRLAGTFAYRLGDSASVDAPPAAAAPRAPMPPAARPAATAAVVEPQDETTRLRRAVRLRPHDVMAHTQLGFALDAAGDSNGARMAFTAARRLLRQAPQDQIERAIEGFSPAELAELLDEKLRG